MAEWGKTVEKSIGNEICSSVQIFMIIAGGWVSPPAFGVFINAEFPIWQSTSLTVKQISLQTGIVCLIFNSVIVIGSDIFT